MSDTTFDGLSPFTAVWIRDVTAAALTAVCISFYVSYVVPKDWTLLTIGAAKGGPLTPVQLQKALFLLARNLTNGQRKTGTFYQFRAYDYGPFNAEVYRDAERLRDEGLVVIDVSGGVRYRDYSPTSDGLQRCTQLRDQSDPLAIDYLDRVVEWVRSLSFDDLVRAIYRDYPEMKANSVFRD